MFSRRPILWLSPLFAVSAVAVVLLAQAEDRKGTKYAFLVACSGYDTTELKRLPYTIKEMKEFYHVLLATGYDAANVKLLHDEQKDRHYLPEKDKILEELRLLLERIEPEDSLLVAFNGHGVQFMGDKSGFFCPIDASLKNRETLLPTEGEEGLFERLKKCKASRKLLIVNACRNNPLSEQSQASKVQLEDRDDDEIPEGIAALYSCRARQESYYYDPKEERTKGRERSLFFHHVIEVWKGSYGKTDKLSVEEFFKEVKVKTAADADNILHRPQTPIVRREYKGKGDWIVRDRVGPLTVDKPRSEDAREARRDPSRPVPPPARVRPDLEKMPNRELKETLDELSKIVVPPENESVLKRLDLDEPLLLKGHITNISGVGFTKKNRGLVVCSRGDGEITAKADDDKSKRPELHLWNLDREQRVNRYTINAGVA